MYCLDWKKCSSISLEPQGYVRVVPKAQRPVLAYEVEAPLKLSIDGKMCVVLKSRKVEGREVLWVEPTHSSLKMFGEREVLDRFHRVAKIRDDRKLEILNA
jgi:hypothetical protein